MFEGRHLCWCASPGFDSARWSNRSIQSWKTLAMPALHLQWLTPLTKFLVASLNVPRSDSRLHLCSRQDLNPDLTAGGVRGHSTRHSPAGQSVSFVSIGRSCWWLPSGHRPSWDRPRFYRQAGQPLDAKERPVQNRHTWWKKNGAQGQAGHDTEDSERAMTVSLFESLLRSPLRQRRPCRPSWVSTRLRCVA